MPEYRSWRAMLRRCYDPLNNRYYAYGARGIVVDSRWLSFKSFLSDMGLRPTLDSTVDRKDNDKPYCLDNCRWLPRNQQARHKRTTIYVQVGREKLPLKPACKVLGLDYKLVHNRLLLGWDLERAMNTPKIEDPTPYLELGRRGNNFAKIR